MHGQGIGGLIVQDVKDSKAQNGKNKNQKHSMIWERLGVRIVSIAKAISGSSMTGKTLKHYFEH